MRGRDASDEAGVLRGKVHYMPPEVIAGTDPVSSRVDLWSLAVTLYEMLTARPLREGVAESDMMAGKYSQKVEPVHKVNPLVPAELSAILSRALHPKVKHRPADAASFYRELKQWLAQSTLVVDAAALARFVRAGTNVSGAEPNTPAPEAGFDKPEYLAPIEFSPTQRYELTHRRKPLRAASHGGGTSVAGTGHGGGLRPGEPPCSGSVGHVRRFRRRVGQF